MTAAALALAAGLGLSGCEIAGGGAGAPSSGPPDPTVDESAPFGANGKDTAPSQGFGIGPFRFGGGGATRGATAPATASVGRSEPALTPELPGAEPSALIAALRDRRSILPDGDYADLAHAVLAARPGPAAATLQAARLRARSESKNWLPSIGPQVSLASAGRLVTTLFVEQTLLDNGRDRAARAYANAEVEAASVALLAEANDRVRDALDLVLTAQEAEARAGVADAMRPTLERYVEVMRARVQGGISSPLDARTVEDALVELLAERDRDRAAAAAARDELARMTRLPISISARPLALAPADPQGAALPDLAAEATARLARAEADAGRAGLFPRLTAVASLGRDTDAGLGASMDSDLGFGTRDALRAIEASAAAADAARADTAETMARQTASLTARIASLQAEAAHAATRAAASETTLRSNIEAQAAGQRSIREVVAVIRQTVDARKQAVSADLDAVRARLELAALNGTLVDGDRL